MWMCETEHLSFIFFGKHQIERETKQHSKVINILFSGTSKPKITMRHIAMKCDRQFVCTLIIKHSILRVNMYSQTEHLMLCWFNCFLSNLALFYFICFDAFDCFISSADGALLPWGETPSHYVQSHHLRGETISHRKQKLNRNSALFFVILVENCVIYGSISFSLFLCELWTWAPKHTLTQKDNWIMRFISLFSISVSFLLFCFCSGIYFIFRNFSIVFVCSVAVAAATAADDSDWRMVNERVKPKMNVNQPLGISHSE